MTATDPCGLYPSTEEAALLLPFGADRLHAASSDACPPPHYPSCAPLIPLYCFSDNRIILSRMPWDVNRHTEKYREKTGAESVPPPARKLPYNAAHEFRQPDADHPHAHPFHLLQVEMSAQPRQTSAAPAIAAQAQPGIHRNSSSNPALMNTHPSSFHSPSSGGRQG